MNKEKLTEHLLDMIDHCTKQYDILMAAGKDELAYEHKGYAKAYMDLVVRIDLGEWD